MAARWRFIVRRGRSAQYSPRGSRATRDAIDSRRELAPFRMNRHYPPALTVGRVNSAHLLYSPAPLFPRSLVWSELSEGDLSALSPRVCEWSLVQRADLYSQKSGLKQCWPRAPAFTGSMLRDAFAGGRLSFSLSSSLDYTGSAFDLNSNWWERSNRGKSREGKKTPLFAFISSMTVSAQ